MLKYLCFGILICIVRSEDDDSTRSNVAMSRIIHGDVVDIEDHPHQVALVARKNTRSKIICGGALVKPRVVFTAAHCTHVIPHARPREGLSVLVGANSLHDPKGTEHKIQKVIKHPAFGYNNFDNDFSVVLLKKPVDYSDRVQNIPISLHDHREGTQATASGYGLTEYGFPSKNLRAVDLTIERHSKCQSYFPKAFHPKITKNHVCVRPDKKTTYYGDSGGPLVVDGKLVGLVSFGRTVSGNKKTTVFTRVRNFLDFADSVIPSDFHHNK
ncbi:trypsin V-B-like [Aethina tumida]|uniref:trypsin V-B-like n=1 Tax=Aethina tumida TaxID=116153 RepID=UPI0021489179|nr:trypsin V-B-like [Aethina tumida]